jgi:hypothetical protein
LGLGVEFVVAAGLVVLLEVFVEFAVLAGELESAGLFVLPSLLGISLLSLFALSLVSLVPLPLAARL